MGRISRLCLLLLALAGCSDGPAHRDVSYLAPPTPGGRLCMDACMKARDSCRESCGLDYRACYNDAQMKAQRDYDAYTRRRFADHMRIEMLPSDFTHAEACASEKKSCVKTCGKPYDACYESCGGTIKVTTSCQFMCFE